MQLRHGRARRRSWRVRRGGSGATTDAGGERSVGGAGAKVLQAPFLEAEVVHRPLEGGVGHEAEVGGGIAEVLTKTGGESGEQDVIPDREPDVVELVRESLEAQAVGVEGEVVLLTTEELLLQENHALELVVGEEADDLGPHLVSVVAVVDDDLEDVRRDGEEYPADDGGVDGKLVGVAAHGEEVGGAVDVVGEVILAEKEVEVGLPSEEVGSGVREFDRDVLGDADLAELGWVGGG